MKFKGDIIITDPCYIIPDNESNDWERCDFGENMEVLGIKNYICRDTIYGDWSCTTFNKRDEEIGQFCADAGMVGVFLLKEVLKYNPKFDYHIKRKWTTTWIKKFDGEINFEIVDDEVSVVGSGNINFYTRQTGA
jgi:hypothetical protein